MPASGIYVVRPEHLNVRKSGWPTARVNHRSKTSDSCRSTGTESSRIPHFIPVRGSLSEYSKATELQSSGVERATDLHCWHICAGSKGAVLVDGRMRRWSGRQFRNIFAVISKGRVRTAVAAMEVDSGNQALAAGQFCAVSGSYRLASPRILKTHLRVYGRVGWAVVTPCAETMPERTYHIRKLTLTQESTQQREVLDASASSCCMCFLSNTQDRRNSWMRWMRTS
jgi:hypothetical protein